MSDPLSRYNQARLAILQHASNSSLALVEQQEMPLDEWAETFAVYRYRYNETVKILTEANLPMEDSHNRVADALKNGDDFLLANADASWTGRWVDERWRQSALKRDKEEARRREEKKQKDLQQQLDVIFNADPDKIDFGYGQTSDVEVSQATTSCKNDAEIRTPATQTSVPQRSSKKRKAGDAFAESIVSSDILFARSALNELPFDYRSLSKEAQESLTVGKPKHISTYSVSEILKMAYNPYHALSTNCAFVQEMSKALPKCGHCRKMNKSCSWISDKASCEACASQKRKCDFADTFRWLKACSWMPSRDPTELRKEIEFLGSFYFQGRSEGGGRTSVVSPNPFWYEQIPTSLANASSSASADTAI